MKIEIEGTLLTGGEEIIFRKGKEETKATFIDVERVDKQEFDLIVEIDGKQYTYDANDVDEITLIKNQ